MTLRPEKGRQVLGQARQLDSPCQAIGHVTSYDLSPDIRKLCQPRYSETGPAQIFGNWAIPDIRKLGQPRYSEIEPAQIFRNWTSPDIQKLGQPRYAETGPAQIFRCIWGFLLSLIFLSLSLGTLSLSLASGTHFVVLSSILVAMVSQSGRGTWTKKPPNLI